MIPRLFLFLSLAASLRAADFPTPYNSEKLPGAPMPAEEAARGFKLPPGFRATVFAAEPDVQNPIACAWDARGRLWIAENYTYAEPPLLFDPALRDRILIFEDTDGDGHFDKRTVFTDELQTLTSIELGFGGVYALCPPQLLFIPMQDDHPSGPPQVLLDGFTVVPESHHTFANGLRWGPDGWLYGRVGASSPSKVGAPGTPDAERVPIAGGIWRYHPQRKVFEMLCHGTTNPWGLDWNEYGDGLFVNTVNGHLWQLIPGAHYERPHTIDPNPHVYQLMQQCADHYHFDTGKGWTESRDGKADAFGGGHAHCGAMIYLGDNWPGEYRGKLFTLNFHGRRMNVERLEREGSGYVGRHDGDMCFAADPWFRGIDLTYGPDGGVFVLDWSDTGECHDSTGVHRTSGRVFKITYGEPKRVEPFDLAKMSNAELVKLQEHKNEWWARMARRVLADRFANGAEKNVFPVQLKKTFEQNSDVPQKLRVLWSLNITNNLDDDWLSALLKDDNEHVRSWAIRLLSDNCPLNFVNGGLPPKQSDVSVATMNDFRDLARTEPSALVRLALASAINRLSLSSRGAVLLALCQRPDDAADHNIPLILWYGTEPCALGGAGCFAGIVSSSRLPTIRRNGSRRIAEEIEKKPALVDKLITAGEMNLPNMQADVVAGMTDAFIGWRKAPKPAAWDEFAAKVSVTNDPAVIAKVRELSALFGDGRALDEIKRVALDAKGEIEVRRKALETLIAERPPDLREICEQLLKVRFLSTSAARGLALFDDPAIGENLAKNYRAFPPGERPAVIDTLASRPAFARSLLAAMEKGAIARGDLTAFHARQIRGFGDAALTQQLAAAWGELHESAGDKRALIAKLKAQLTPEVLAKGDAGAGRMVFNTTCAVCHTLYGHGGQIGPDLTGANRDNLDYLLENIVDPSAVVSADFRMTVATLKDGRVLNGIATARTDRTLTLKTLTGPQTVERAEIGKEEQLAQSMMPEGLLLALSETQVRDLLAYLMTKAQVPLP